MADKVTNDIKSVEKNLFDEINKIKILDNVIVHPKNNYFETLFLIGKHFDFIFDYGVNNEEKLKYRETIINNFLSKNVIDDFYISLTKLFNEIEEIDTTSKAVENNLPRSVVVLLDIFARCSETNQEFGNEICKRENLIQFFVRIIKQYKLRCINDSLSKTELKILELSIRNLYSTVIYDSEVNIHKLQKLKVLESLQYFEKCPNPDIKIRFALLVAYISEENNSSGFVGEIRSFPVIIKLLSESVKTGEYSIKQEYSTLELIKAVEKLSKNDKNKRTMVEMGILPILKVLLETNCTKYQNISLSILWNLAFDEKNKSEIAKMFLETISDLTNSKNLKLKEQLSISSVNTAENKLDKNVSNQNMKREIGTTFYIECPTKKSEQVLSHSNNLQIHGSQQDSTSQKLNGLMWILTNHQNENSPSPSAVNSQGNSPSNQKHVMISYCHENDDFALKLYDELKARNFKLWIDKHDMTANQNLMEAMAQAVEQSWAVIICISHCYKNSESCRAEAQYAKDNKKPLIPIIIQEKYRPDGWLGICITGIQYLNFSGKYSFEESMSMLVKQLEQFKNEQHKSELTKPQIITDHSELDQSNENHISNQKISDWSNSKVVNWFRQIGIKKFTWKSHYTGSELEFLKSISGEKLMEFCQSELDIYDLKDIRILSEELKRL